MSIDLSSAFEQPIKGVSVEVKFVKDIEKANPKSFISLFARLGSVGYPSDVSSKLRKGAAGLVSLRPLPSAVCSPVCSILA